MLLWESASGWLHLLYLYVFNLHAHWYLILPRFTCCSISITRHCRFNCFVGISIPPLFSDFELNYLALPLLLMTLKLLCVIFRPASYAFPLRVSGKICALDVSNQLPKRAESQCPPALIADSPDDYQVEVTIAKRGVDGRGILVKPIIFETAAAEVIKFVFSEFELRMQVGTPKQIPELVSCFLLKVANFR